MVEVKRKPNESRAVCCAVFRVSCSSQESLRRKSLKYRAKKVTDRMEKNRAIMGMHLRKLRQNLEKLGKYSEENFEEAKRRLKQEIEL